MVFFLLTIDKLTVTVPNFIVLASGFTALYVGWQFLFRRTPATPSTGAFQPRPRPAHTFPVSYPAGEHRSLWPHAGTFTACVAVCKAFAVEIFHKAAADPVSFAYDILGYSFSVYVVSVIYYIALQFVKGSIANITEAHSRPK